MVEFGLKLQDNQVSEWSDHYISYEQLKTLLKQAKQARQRYQENAKKRPALAEQVKDNYDKGISQYVTGTPPISASSLRGMVRSLSSGSLRDFAAAPPPPESSSSPPDDSEKTGLINRASKDSRDTSSQFSYGAGTEREVPVESPTSTSGLHSVLNKAASSVSGYFEKRYETALRENLKEIDRLEGDFDDCLMLQVSKRSYLWA
jgi:hypothetical protein